jgi:hypothetical protein
LRGCRRICTITSFDQGHLKRRACLGLFLWRAEICRQKPELEGLVTARRAPVQMQ